jgi:hypothetical protein
MTKTSTLRVFEENHPTLAAFVRLVLLLAGYGGGGFLGLCVIFYGLLHIMPVWKYIADALGGGHIANFCAFLISFILFACAQVAVGISIGTCCSWFEKKWPNNSLFRIIQWVKNVPFSPCNDTDA